MARAKCAASLANRALSDGNNKTNKLPGEQSGPSATLQARFTRRIQETENRVRLAPVECTPQPDDRVNARLRASASKIAASATYKLNAIYPSAYRLILPPSALFFFANNDACIMQRP